MTLRVRVWALLLVVAGTTALAATADEFYDRLYARGLSQFNEGNYGGAYASLRLAAFGLLEDVKRFETAQVYMTVAAMRLRHEADARAAAQRVATAQRIQNQYGSLGLPDAVRKEFEDAARTLLTAEQQGALRGTWRPPAQPQPQAPAPATTPAPQPRPAQPQPQPVVRSQPTPPLPIKSQPQAAASAAPAPSFADAERALNAGDLARARTLYRTIVDSQQLSHAAVLRAAEGLYRSRDFAGAIKAFDRAGAIGKGEEQYHWYYAVALYETGRRREAKRELHAALPYIEMSREVERYAALIDAAAD